MSFFDGVNSFLNRVFGSSNERALKPLWDTVERINALESGLESLSDQQLRDKTPELRDRLAKGESLDDLLEEAFACVRESSRRHLKTVTGVPMRHFDVQLIGGMVLHSGSIAEMTTGEGKTLVATLPAYLNALPGKGVHVVTVNDYLARRDAQWMTPVFEGLGMTVGAIQSNMSSAERIEQYSRDITYGTNNEFGFDYLRDNMKVRPEEQCQKHRAFAIIDEVDSILIDEARTPLIISGPAEHTTDKYYKADAVVRKLEKDVHFEVKEKDNSVLLTEDGIERAEHLVGVDSFYTPANMTWPHHIEQALRAHHLHKKDVHYVVKDGEIVIVDEFTGRMMEGRRWSDGLHQAVEAKEGLKIKQENQTLATITFQNFFRLYDKIAGMTGTAMTEASEFMQIYGLGVIAIPTNKPMQRKSEPDVVYRTKPEKWKAIADQIGEIHKTGRPILVGTISIEDSELLSGMLDRRGVKHSVLNAKHHEREAEIVAVAGQPGAVTIATNMAGRGTDIVLGPGVLEMGGLFVLGCERHESRRIDNQLRGRCGRQGDPGASQFYLSLEDDLMRIFASERVSALLKRFGMTDGVDITHPMVSRAIERAQKKVEARNFEIRKNLLEYDGVMNEQRKLVYDLRDRILRDVDLRALLVEFFEEIISARSAEDVIVDREGLEGLDGLTDWLRDRYGIEIEPPRLDGARNHSELAERLVDIYDKVLDQKEIEATPQIFEKLLHYILLQTIDDKWKDHLHAMDQLRHGIGMRSYGQMDPKLEYKREGYQMFSMMLQALKEDTTALVPRVQIRINEQQEREAQQRLERRWGGGVTSQQLEEAHEQHGARMRQGIEGSQNRGAPEAPKQIVNTEEKTGRNDPCPCGSGKKFKKCCGA
ncbi:MAG: preprotein translocase subunit SecA [Planctomycetes bacterium]|nr:preprotein translocase subunit SecA [Planctomycetota bacterium]